MRTANNNSNFTVEALVAKYRNFVIEHCPKSCEFDGVEEFLMPISPDANADEQLLITLYSAVTGTNADKRILTALSKYADKFKKDGLEEDEFVFLCENFSDVVSYEFAHRHDWFLGDSGRRISEERIKLVKKYVKPTNGARIFIADTEYCDLAVMFPNCIISGFTGWNYMHQEVWALGQIRLFAAHIPSEIVSGEEINGEYKYTLPSKGSVDVVIFRVNESKYFAQNTFGTECKNVEALFDLLKPNGKMLFFSEVMWEMAGKLSGKRETFFDFRTRLVKEKAISAIVSYEDKALLGNDKSSYSLLVLNKEVNKDVWIIDEKKNLSEHISSTSLDCEILLPSYYMVTRPSNGIPLSSVVILPEEEVLADFIKGKGFVLPEDAKDMLLVLSSALGESYKDANLRQKSLITVNDPNLKEEDWISFRVAKAPCILMSGKSDKLKVGYTTKVPQSGFAYMAGCCLLPKMGIDVRYVAALLFEPSVIEQILTICDGNIFQTYLSLVLDKIFVPNHDEKERLSFLSEANYEALVSTQDDMKREQELYSKSVRMRKHALTQSLSSIESMFYALNNYRIKQNGLLHDDDVISRIKGTTVQNAFDFLSKGIKDMMPKLEHIAEVEHTFAKPEWIDPEKFIEDYIKKNEKGWLNFKPIITWEQGHNQVRTTITDNPSSGNVILPEGTSYNLFLFPKDALERVFKNIISNAKAHGFSDKTRYDYQVRFSWRMDGMSLIVEIENNGMPIPNDRDTASLLEYGVSTNLHNDGHNGIGCNEIDEIMKKYDGKVEIISLPENEFSVKYILTFNRSKTVRSF